MDSWIFDTGSSRGDGSGPPDGVIVATEETLPLRLERLEPDPTIGAGLVILGSYLGNRLVARCAVPPAAAAMIEDRGLLRDPVRIALAAREASPGLQCQLFALVTMPRDLGQEEAPEEPWAASVPGSGYDRAVGEQEAQDEAEAAPQAAVLLGQIVRFARDRRHPGSLPDEAIDVLSTIVQGELVEVVDKLLDDLLD